MTHYDDLQRFKDKTHTQTIAFKDMSAQRHAQEKSSWTIINQLTPKEDNSALAAAGHVSRSVEPVSSTAFDATQSTPPPSTQTNLSHAAPALLREVAQQLPAATATPAPEPAAAATSIQPSVASAGLPFTAQIPPPVAAAPSQPVAPQPAAAPVYSPPVPPPAAAPVYAQAPAAAPMYSAPAPQSAGAVNYSQLFAVKKPEAPHSEEKDQPLQGLFERIATCR